MTPPTIRRLPARLVTWISDDIVAGSIMIAAAALGLVWANSPIRDSYTALSEVTVGPAALHLDLTLSTWAADGLLAIFFFVVGVELKHELVAGSLRSVREAGVPVAAAVGGMIAPAVIYAVIVLATAPGPALHGWAVPTATDIAFALAILAIFGRGLPRPLRLFLLTLAVADDLLAIIVIAIFYSDGFHPIAFLAALAAVVLFAWAVRLPRPHWWLLIPLAAAAWVFMHSSGIHATIAGVLLGLSVPARSIHGEPRPRTRQLEHSVRPVSSGIALPVFAFFAAGVTVVGQEAGPLAALTEPVAIAILVALVVGKLVGVLGTTALVTRLTPLRLPDGIGLRDLFPIGLLAGIGFTVSLLIAELSFGDGEHAAPAKFAILTASALAATLAAAALRWDAHKKRRADMNQDGIDDTDTGVIGRNPISDD